MFPKNTQLVSAVYSISVSKPLLKPLRLEMQHCVDIRSSAHTKYLKFAVASVDQSNLPYEFVPVDGGKFVSEEWYGTIERKMFSPVCVLYYEDDEDEDQHTDDDDAQQNGTSDEDTEQHGGTPPEGDNSQAGSANHQQEKSTNQQDDQQEADQQEDIRIEETSHSNEHMSPEMVKILYVTFLMIVCSLYLVNSKLNMKKESLNLTLDIV